MKGNSTIIKYKNLYVTGYVGDQGEEEEVRLPIENIPEMEEGYGEHIHGYLTITIGEKKLDYLGFFGDDDVCFNDWIGHLRGIVECFSKSVECRFLFYDGEQGDPAFEFYRNNELVFITTVNPEVFYSLSAEKTFERRSTDFDESSGYICDYQDFDRSVRDFLKEIEEEIATALGDFSLIWWERNTGIEGKCSHRL